MALPARCQRYERLIDHLVEELVADLIGELQMSPDINPPVTPVRATPPATVAGRQRKLTDSPP